MSKRLTDTEIWKEDWFLSLPLNYKLFWKYLCDACDHAGVWRPNIVFPNRMFGFKIQLSKALELFNADSKRIEVLENGRWFLKKFIEFQYGKKLNNGSPTYRGIKKSLEYNGLSIEGLGMGMDGVSMGLGRGMDTVKDKDKDNPLLLSLKTKEIKQKENNKGIEKSKPNSAEEVTEYAKSIGFSLDGHKFFNYYQSKGWVIGKSPMKDWKAAVRTWKHQQNGFGGGLFNGHQEPKREPSIS